MKLNNLKLYNKNLSGVNFVVQIYILYACLSQNFTPFSARWSEIIPNIYLNCQILSCDSVGIGKVTA